MKIKLTSLVAALVAFALALVSTVARAHSFVEPYLLPLPFWLYVYACGAALVVTFGILGYFIGAADAVRPAWAWPVRPSGPLAVAGHALRDVLRLGSLACLVLTIVAGTIGTGDPLRNISMPLFWMVFLLGFTYLQIAIGNVYEVINPWATMVAWIEHVAPGFCRERIRYPERFGYYPAFMLYVAVIWIELFVLPKPSILANALLLFTLLTFVGAFVFGRQNWFRYCDPFAALFRLVASLAPVAYVPAGTGRWNVFLRAPFRGAAEARLDHLSLVLFILFMLSSTTFDAMHETDMWVSFYWKHLIVFAQPLWGTDMVKAQNVLMPWYHLYQRAGLLLSPFAYLALYVLILGLTKRITQASVPLRKLALEFAPSLIPIAVVYNITHYYTILITQLSKFPLVATDPFGFGWNLLGLGATEPSPPLDMGFVWHTQVALILIGHVVSVYLAHVAAMRVFATRRQALLSQLPLLLLMVAYTAIGLYILALPLATPTFAE